LTVRVPDVDVQESLITSADAAEALQARTTAKQKTAARLTFKRAPFKESSLRFAMSSVYSHAIRTRRNRV
jgi:hypothetical protein